MFYSKENPEMSQNQPLIEEDEARHNMTPEEKIAKIKAGFLPYEPFDPESEVAKISKLPKEEKKEALERFKEEYADQRVGILRLHNEIQYKIEDNPDISREDLDEMIYERAEELKLAPQQFGKIENVLDNYGSVHSYVKQMREQYPDDDDLFEAAFGVRPVGKIRVKEGPVTLHFVCADLRDYGKALGIDKDYKVYSETKNEAARYIRQGITAENREMWGSLKEMVFKREPDMEPYSAVHEEGHQVAQLFLKTRAELTFQFDETALKAAETDEEAQAILNRVFRNAANVFTQMTREEIIIDLLAQGKKDFFEKKNVMRMMAYYANLVGTQNEVTANTFEDHLDWGPGFRKMLEEAKESSEQKHYETVAAGIKAIKDLLSGGFNEKEAVNLFTPEPIENWFKLAQRILAEKNTKKPATSIKK
jgi:hypothetical protein